VHLTSPSADLARPTSADTLQRAAAYFPGAAVLGVALALSFTSGGYMLLSATPWVLALLAALGVWVVVARPAGQPTVTALVAVIALGLTALWSGVSIVWSVGPDLSWIAFNYAGLYAAAALALVWGRVRRGQLVVACVGFLVCVTVVAVYAYLGKIVPDVVQHAHEYARLAAPVGYWNVLAVMLVMAAPVALSLAARRGLSPYVRAAAAAVLALLLVTLFFTFSRGGFASAVVMLVVYFAVTRERLSAFVSLLVAALPVALVLWHLRGLETLFATTTNDALRTAEGHTLATWTIVILVVPFVVQLAVAFVHHRVTVRPVVVRWVGAGLLVALVGLLVVAPLTYLQLNGGVSDWFSRQYNSFTGSAPVENGQQGDTADRLKVVSSNGRVSLYRESLDQAEHTPWLGTGAGTFTFTNYRFRETGLVVKHAHSQWFNTLSELGVVGLALLAVFVLAVVAALITVLVRRWRDRERALLAAVTAASIAFLFHISGDWDWDMAAITLGFLLLAITASGYRGSSQGAPAAAPAAVVAPTVGEADQRAAADADFAAAPSAESSAAVGAAAEPAAGSLPAAPAAGPASTAGSRSPLLTAARAPRLSWPAAALWAGLLAVLMVSWLLPFLSARAEDRALAAVSHNRLGPAQTYAARARTLNPLATDPLLTLAAVEEGRGRPQAALSALRDAVRLQPDNYYVHYRLGVFLYSALGRNAAAARQFKLALELNPMHGLSRSQLDLIGAR
jgi:uncharacterized membrane protein YhaH (DUF805 family)